MNIGDCVICVNSENINSGSSDDLTLGKEYIVLDIEYSSGYDDDDEDEETGSYLITVINNHGDQFGYYEYRFKTLMEYRRDKLRRLNLV